MQKLIILKILLLSFCISACEGVEEKQEADFATFNAKVFESVSDQYSEGELKMTVIREKDGTEKAVYELVNKEN